MLFLYRLYFTKNCDFLPLVHIFVMITDKEYGTIKKK